MTPLVVRTEAVASRPRVYMYLTGQHPVPPTASNPEAADALDAVTHVALAFAPSGVFNSDQPIKEWPVFTDIPSVRLLFRPSTRILIAVGGWGDTSGFEAAARDDASRHRWATRLAELVHSSGADGTPYHHIHIFRQALSVDIDWEYPGGNGEDYKRAPNRDKAWQIDAYPLLLAHVRAALGPSPIVSAAVPGLERDMLAFSAHTIPAIMASVDFLNVMTYDLMNRRDDTTRHHTGVAASLAAVDAYISRGVSPAAINLGFAWYVRWFRTGDCDPAAPVGCPTLPLEDPATGDDLGHAGAFSWHDPVPANLAESFARALGPAARYDTDGSYYYWDPAERLWWTLDDVAAQSRKLPRILAARRLGGVFAWGLGEDGPVFAHFIALVRGVRELGARDEI